MTEFGSKVNEKPGEMSYGFASNLSDALPNALAQPPRQSKRRTPRIQMALFPNSRHPVLADFVGQLS